MITTIDIANFCITSIGTTISVMGLLLTASVRFIEKWLKNFFIIVFSIMISYALSAFISLYSLEFLGNGFSTLTKAAIFLESFFSSILMPILTVCLLHVCRQRLKCVLFFLNIGLWGLYFILLIITQFTTFIYYITPDNVYRRGPLYPLLLVPPVLLMFSNLIGVCIRRKYLSDREFHSFLLYLLIPMISTVFQMLSYGLLLIVLGSTISAMVMFLYIMNDQISSHMMHTREIAAQNLTIRTLQMRPHFIYNTLSNIYYLCEQDPHKAQAAVDVFTRYLRKNFTAITSEKMIPFTEELEHARAYLSVVKIRFEELIFVEYDTKFTAFKIPPLTLEPIVENAVKHGLDPDSSPLNILVRTVINGEKAVITVEDSGTGYDPSDTADTSESKTSDDDHIGLSNVRSRLHEMCKGTLDIAPRDKGGTIVTIVIPL